MPEVDALINVLIEKQSNGVLLITKLYQSGITSTDSIVLPAAGTGWKSFSKSSPPPVGRPRSDAEADLQNKANNTAIEETLADYLNLFRVSSENLTAESASISDTITAKSVTIYGKEYDGKQVQEGLDVGIGPIARAANDMASGLNNFYQMTAPFTKDEYERLIQSLIAPPMPNKLTNISPPIKVENKPVKPDRIYNRPGRPSRGDDNKSQLARIEQSAKAKRPSRGILTNAVDQGPPDELKPAENDVKRWDDVKVIFDGKVQDSISRKDLLDMQDRASNAARALSDVQKNMVDAAEKAGKSIRDYIYATPTEQDRAEPAKKNDDLSITIDWRDTTGITAQDMRDAQKNIAEAMARAAGIEAGYFSVGSFADVNPPMGALDPTITSNMGSLTPDWTDAANWATQQNSAPSDRWVSWGSRVGESPEAQEMNQIRMRLKQTSPTGIAGTDELLDEVRQDPRPWLDRIKAIVFGSFNNRRICDKAGVLVKSTEIEGMDRVQLLDAMLSRGFQVASQIKERWYLMDGKEMKTEPNQPKWKRNSFEMIDFD